ncbi:3-hydroxyacyl-CoA dehydrogenase-like protein [Penicillium solitum]|uniref:3-hydroxyacyl-CoA dehydrogenase-like protein n=1 Tax=Penicillium solitum TaxID=60172 RepID=UPI0032C436D9|nr:3-hydroxyacyl-CoA dehydrogenase-like protein [Penicillium solitum]
MPPEIKAVELMTSTYTDDTRKIILGHLWAAVKRDALCVLSENFCYSPGRRFGWVRLSGHPRLEMFQGNERGPCEMMDAVGLDTVKLF